MSIRERRRSYRFLHNPSASNVVANADGTVTLRLEGEQTVVATAIDTCNVICQQDCSPQVWRIQFKDVDFGDCSTCYKGLGITIKQERNSRFDHPTFSETMTEFLVEYAPAGGAQGTVTAAALAAYLQQSILAARPQHSNGLDYLGITPTLATTTVSNDTLVLTGRCPNRFDVFISEITQQLPAAERPIVSLVSIGMDARMTREIFVKEYGPMYDFLTGQDIQQAATFFSNCEQICALTLEGCIPACGPNSPEGIIAFGSVAVPIAITVYYNAAASGTAAFLTALESAFTICSDNTITDSAVPTSGTTLYTLSASTINIVTGYNTARVANPAFGGPYQLALTSGGVPRVAIAIPADVASNPGGIAYLLNQAYPAGTFSATGNSITASGAAVTGGSPVWTIKVP
jgi:hypothetical protein